MSIAHILIAHKNPLQLERLIKKMQYPEFDFYVHIDNKVDIGNFLYLKDIAHYPIKSNDEIHSIWWENAIHRYQRCHLTEFTFMGRFYVEKIINKLLPKRKFHCL